MPATSKAAFDLTGDVAIVSGAGSRMKGEIGNGRACAILLARQGAKVALFDNNVQWAQGTKDMIDAECGISEVIEVDVAEEVGVKQAVERTVELFGRIDILVNVVGVAGPIGDATNVDISAWDRDLRTNLTSMVLTARHVIPHMRRNGRGSVVNMSSILGLVGDQPFNLLYPTTKGAIVQMTRAMAAQHGHENIRVNCVAPGMVYTPMVRVLGVTEEKRKQRIEQNLMKQEGDAWDVGYAVLFLCSREAKWITGLIMPVDGGVSVPD